MPAATIEQLREKQRQWAIANAIEAADQRAIRSSRHRELYQQRKRDKLTAACVHWGLGAPALPEYWWAGYKRLCVMAEHELHGTLTEQMIADRANLRAWLRRHWELAPTPWAKAFFRGPVKQIDPSYAELLAEISGG